MNTPLKMEEEKIWKNWYRHLFGDDVYLINTLSCVKEYEIPSETRTDIDYSVNFHNPGHIAGCCQGLNLGLRHLLDHNYEGIVVLTVPDAIADEGFKNILDIDLSNSQTIYAHDWGPDHIAMDFILLPPKVAKLYRVPEYHGANHVIDKFGNPIPCIDHTAVLEKWNHLYIKNEFPSYKVFSQKGEGGPGWSTNIGTWFKIPGCEFRVVQSGGDARRTKTHVTDKYYEFDINNVRKYESQH